MRLRYQHLVKSLSNARRASSSTSPFSDTVLLPKTNFHAKVTAKVVSREKQIQEKCGFESLYQWQSEHNQGDCFILHDGPPYANGDVHAGHALNKILKDITNRYKMMRGYRIHYIPGWDCHGLPIEIKAIKTKDNFTLDPMQIREAARKFAEKNIKQQKQAFKRWGVMADWSNSGCYFTFAKEFEARELEAFYEIYKNGLIYRDLKPVYWSSSSRTALAESELEYNANHKSRSIYFLFPLRASEKFKDYLPDGSQINIIVWTTQPWTIPANKAVCYSSEERYCLVRLMSPEVKYCMLAVKQLEDVQKLLNAKFEIVTTFQGELLKGQTCHHPMDNQRLIPLLPSSHVTMDKGTGFVHAAPAHGAEDFTLAVQHGLDVTSQVDDDGKFSEEAGYSLQGKFIFTEGNSSVIGKIQESNNLIHEHEYTHSYPYDWRTKKPIFVKTSRQWFVDTESLKHVAGDLLENVNVIPSTGRASMMSHLKGRTFWCISRQRAWGVPIPVFYKKHKGETLLSENNEMLLTDKSIGHITSVVREHGTDAWWKLPMVQLLPQDVLDDAGFRNSSPDDFRIGQDILDIWFDSGLTWASVLCKDQKDGFSEAQIADLYLEGKDQCGGWFQSSLLTSCAIRAKAPYKNLLVHGFVMAESKQKMSKSLGNVVDPMVITDGGKNPTKDPPYGADVLRMWVAESNIYNEVLIGKNILDSSKDSLNKIRLCFRFLLGNLNGFDPKQQAMPFPEMWSVDRYIHTLLRKYSMTVTEAYNAYDYGKVTRLLLSFIRKISSFYFTIIKDRLYCGEKSGIPRLSCLTTLYNTLDVLAKSAAPILPHTMEEVVLHHPCPGYTSIFKDGWCEDNLQTYRGNSSLEDAFSQLLKIREIFISNLDTRQPSVCDLQLKVSEGLMFVFLKSLQSTGSSDFSELREVFGSSNCTLTRLLPGEDTGSCLVYEDINFGTCVLSVTEPRLHKCQRCRLYTTEKSTNPCDRCATVIAAPWAD